MDKFPITSIAVHPRRTVHQVLLIFSRFLRSTLRSNIPLHAFVSRCMPRWRVTPTRFSKTLRRKARNTARLWRVSSPNAPPEDPPQRTRIGCTVFTWQHAHNVKLFQVLCFCEVGDLEQVLRVCFMRTPEHINQGLQFYGTKPCHSPSL